MPIRRSGLLLAALAQLLAAAASAWTHSPLTNLPVCTNGGNQVVPQMVLDGAGGAIAVWRDDRGGAGTDDIYAQHVLGDGTVDPAWPAGGRLVCGATNLQDNPRVITDGAQGAIVVWNDFRNGSEWKLYARHVLANGTNDPAWPADGRALCSASGNQLNQAISPDGAGGLIVAWQDDRAGTYRVYAMHALSNGILDGSWPTDGLLVASAAGAQYGPDVTSDYAGGVFVAWLYQASPSTATVYVQHLLSSGAADPGWPVSGRLAFNSGATVFSTAIVTDGAGGVIVTGQAFTVGISVVLAQRVKPSGVLDPVWPTTGLPLPVGSSSGALFQSLAPDWAGGGLVILQEGVSGNFDLTAHHVLGSGALDPAWPANGLPVCRATGNQQDANAVYDFAGGVFVTWRDFRGGATADVYAHHILSSGVTDPGWPTDGRVVCRAAGDQANVGIVPDLAGGVVIAWADGRNGNSDIYAQNITTFGVLGDPEPAIESVADLPDDQGGHVRIRWSASQMDVAPYYDVGSYGIWREVSEATALQALARGARRAESNSDEDVDPGVFRTRQTATQTTWWEGVGMVGARGDAWYTFVAETFRDSSGAGNPLTAFFVEARGATQIGWWDSAPVSGYSVDNLAPDMPAPFTGEYASGTAHLHWNPNVERDFAGYRLYRGTTSTFVPSPGNLVTTLADTGYADAAGEPYVYKLTAVDLHDNESPAATLELPVSTDVDGALAPHELSFAAPMPNPATAMSKLRFDLPRAARVRLAVYDAAGRMVREIARDTRAAGRHAASWDLRDAGGRVVGGGLYFVRLEVEGYPALTRRVAITR